jgi:hypothetical protein
MARKTLRLVWSQPSAADASDEAEPQRQVVASCDVQLAYEPPIANPPTPHYLIVRAGHECYVLDVERELIRRGASQLLKAFARRRSPARSLDSDTWDSFTALHQFSTEERIARCMFSLVAGGETARQLELLATL